ncbi:hypothetical protein V1J52_16065 [Streptomyces sp. TRM 70351]|uniref:hypothetical protein n=1 Tax=Streptomyces sp. TRM 70351 TaxID=3116552 RepID=UPI002E7AB095|nr:hypothetical protein [Streptomyces sp. TRM 70351]MEE1929683.1 hypothetical protein [Streptomyces sp. TRM 70351]
MITTLTTDHPGWIAGSMGEPVRLVVHDDAPWLAAWQPAAGLLLRPLALAEADGAAPPPAPRTTPQHLPDGSDAAPLVRRLVTLGTVQRLTNPSLWDAITTAILRQVVRAEQARKVHRRFSAAHGRTFDTPAGRLSLVPGPEVVLDLPDEAFAETGTAFHRTALRAAAAAYLEDGPEWAQLAPEDLVKALDEVRRIGPWTASAAAADYTGDFSVYPHGDLAVRTWASRAAPGVPFPDSDRAFANRWRRLADDDRRQLHALTLFALTWGSHARTERANAAVQLAAPSGMPPATV